MVKKKKGGFSAGGAIQNSPKGKGRAPKAPPKSPKGAPNVLRAKRLSKLYTAQWNDRGTADALALTLLSKHTAGELRTMEKNVNAKVCIVVMTG